MLYALQRLLFTSIVTTPQKVGLVLMGTGGGASARPPGAGGALNSGFFLGGGGAGGFFLPIADARSLTDMDLSDSGG